METSKLRELLNKKYYLPPYRQTYNSEKMTTTSLDDTLPLLSDDEKTYYGSDLSFSEESEEGSIQLLYEIINLENSRSLYSEAPNIICKAILLDLLEEIIKCL